MRRYLLLLAAVAVAALAFAGIAAAQSGHFNTGGNHAPECTDEGTTVECTAKVSGLGGETFRVTIDAVGVAEVVCINPGGNRAPGQDTEVETSGTTGSIPTPRNGSARVTVSTEDPGPLPPTPTCPNVQWTPNIVDVEFTTATLRLFENGNLSDTVTVPVN
jgi:hypothetical protein